MRRPSHLLVLAAGVFFACSDSPQAAKEASPPSDEAVQGDRADQADQPVQAVHVVTPEAAVSGRDVPTTGPALFAWLKGQPYRDWTQESAVDTGIHGLHKAYFSPELITSLRESATAHPAGAAAIKELYDAQNQLSGWRVAVKTQADSDDGAGWFWYFVGSTTDDSKASTSGAACTACHGPPGGVDYIQSDPP